MRFIETNGYRDECYNGNLDPTDSKNLLLIPSTSDQQNCDDSKQALLDLVCSESNGTWKSWCR